MSKASEKLEEAELTNEQLEEILDTIHNALDDYQGDSTKIVNAQSWLSKFYAVLYPPDEEEQAALKAAIEASEEEDARGFYHTTEEVEARLDTLLEKLNQQNKIVAS